ncbi:MAG TPA: hypothetical protein VG847_04925 [Chitinophagaceae bacterium]|nr:hypothetical protein [Chitinophagaceae bacterium]
MKKLFIILSSFCIIAISCNNSSSSVNAAATKDSLSATTSSNSVSSGDKGTITCNMDGTAKTFHVSQSFFEIPLDVDRTGPKNGIEILDGDSKKEGFQFELKNSGTTKIKSDATGDLLCVINYYNPRGVTYTGKDVTIVVTSYDQQHLTATFSGTLDNVYYDLGTNGAKNYPKSVEITDGKIDVHK